MAFRYKYQVGELVVFDKIGGWNNNRPGSNKQVARGGYTDDHGWINVRFNSVGVIIMPQGVAMRILHETGIMLYTNVENIRRLRIE